MLFITESDLKVKEVKFESSSIERGRIDIFREYGLNERCEYWRRGNWVARLLEIFQLSELLRR